VTPAAASVEGYGRNDPFAVADVAPMRGRSMYGGSTYMAVVLLAVAPYSSAVMATVGSHRPLGIFACSMRSRTRDSAARMAG
jgi:hypothetical protein